MNICHSFVIDPDDRSFVEEKVFTQSELREIRTYKQKPLPDMPQDLLEYLGNYQLNTSEHRFLGRSHGNYLTIDKMILTGTG